MDKLKSILQNGKARCLVLILLSLPVAALILYLAVSGASKQMVAPRTEAAPLAETDVTFDMRTNKAYTAEDGVIVIRPAAIPLSVKAPAQSSITVDYTPEQVWEHDNQATYNNFTMPEKTELKDGSIGLLTIPKLNLSANIYETDDQMEDMTHGIAHFKSTSAWEGNIGLAAHNVNQDLTDGYFKELFLLKEGDEILYTTRLGERKYEVSTVKEIADNDWSLLGRTEDNRITMITCITGKPSKRLCVQAMEKK